MKRLTTVLMAFVLALFSNRLLSGQELDYDTTLLTFTSEPSSLGQDWLGLRVTTLPDDLRQKLDLPKEQGLVVREVVPDSPGAKASIKPDDILLKAGDKPVKTYTDILEAVRDAKKSGLALEFLRDGKTYDVVIKPVNRPSGFELPEGLQLDGGAISKNPLAEQQLHRAQLQRIRAELQGVQQRIGAINRELAQLDQLSQANPDLEKMMRQAAAMRRAADELAAAGRTEDAERLRREMRELSERINAATEAGPGGPLGGAMVFPNPGMLAAPPNGLAQRTFTVMDLAAPIEPPAAVPLQFNRSLSLIQPQQPDPAVGELRKQVEQMRHELNELREFIAKKKE
ncbi:MAG TPA: PDZ domain-containing protein [Pirellulales bacterium]|jgi:membrane-associated protease RseP (regulator of RpoE activity)|nr:PDZ domain-containing protein [Pirellulales bacterium]